MTTTSLPTANRTPDPLPHMESSTIPPAATPRTLAPVIEPFVMRLMDSLDGPALWTPAGPAAPRGGETPRAAAEPLASAERRTNEAVAFFLTRATAHPADGNAPPAVAVAAGVGIGKSEAVIRRLASAELVGHHVHYYVPDLILADEIAKRVNERPEASSGPLAFVFRGRTQAQSDGKPLCAKAEVAERVARLGLPVWRSLCERPADNGAVHRCEHFATCTYVAQMQHAAAARVLVLPHAHLFLGKPEPLPAPHFSVIDEQFWKASLRGVDDHPRDRPAVGWHDLRASCAVPGTGGIDQRAFDELQALSHRAAALFEVGADSPAAFRAAGFGADHARRALVLEQRRSHIDMAVSPAMSADVQRRLLAAVPARRSSLLLRFWHVLADELTHAPHRETFHGIVPTMLPSRAGGAPGCSLRWSADLAPHVRHRPVLVLDATADTMILRRFLPHLEEPIRIDAAWPHVDVIQVQDTVTPKNGLVPSDGAAADELRRRARNREKLAQRTEIEVARAGGPRRDGQPVVLTVTYKEAVRQGTESRMRAVLGADVRWFNAVRGRDAWRGVGGLVVAGRPQPNAVGLETMALALFFRDPMPFRLLGDNRYPRRPRSVALADGTDRAIDTDYHPDPRAEAVRWQICEAELLQVVGRPRPPRRSPGRPLRVVLLTAIPLPITVTTLVPSSALEPSPIEVLAARGAMPLKPWGDLAEACSEFFETGEAARKAVGRALTPDGSLWEYLCRGLAAFSVVRYRRRRADQRAVTGTLAYHPQRIKPAAWLSTHLPGAEITGKPSLLLHAAVAQRTLFPAGFKAYSVRRIRAHPPTPRPAIVESVRLRGAAGGLHGSEGLAA